MAVIGRQRIAKQIAAFYRVGLVTAPIERRGDVVGETMTVATPDERLGAAKRFPQRLQLFLAPREAAFGDKYEQQRRDGAQFLNTDAPFLAVLVRVSIAPRHQVVGQSRFRRQRDGGARRRRRLAKRRQPRSARQHVRVHRQRLGEPRANGAARRRPFGRLQTLNPGRRNVRAVGQIGAAEAPSLA